MLVTVVRIKAWTLWIRNNWKVSHCESWNGRDGWGSSLHFL